MVMEAKRGTIREQLFNSKGARKVLIAKGKLALIW